MCCFRDTFLGFFRSTNRFPSDNSQERKIRCEIDPFKKCQRKNRSTAGCSKLKRFVDMTSSGKNGLNI